MRPSVAVSSLLLCALVAGCAQSNGGGAVPASNGSPLSRGNVNAAHSDQIGYVFGDDIHIDQSTVTGTREVIPKKCKA